MYGELRYDGEKIPTLLSLDTEGYVVRVDSFSKTLAPALRMGSVTGAPEVVSAMSCVRGDLGVSQFLARVVAKYVAEGLYDKHVEMVNELYRRKRDSRPTRCVSTAATSSPSTAPTAGSSTGCRSPTRSTGARS